MKYNKSNIMKRAWELVKKLVITISEGLKRAWAEAKGGYELAVKEWVIDKAQDIARNYNIFIDYTRRTNDNYNMALVDNGYVYVKVEEKLDETEKAIKVRLGSGEVVGSYKGWTLWIPKSQIA